MPAGTFSDDSSMMLATMNSIANNGGEIDYDDIMVEFVKWWKFGKYTQYGDAFDIGITTSSALNKFRNGAKALDSGLCGERDNGNGSLMRILPLAFIEDIGYETIENVSAVTHAHERSKIACVFYVELAKSILSSENPIEEHVRIASDKIKENYRDSSELEYFDRILEGSIFDDPIDSIKSTGYVLSTLEAVIYVLGNTNSYKEAVLMAVNLGNDTDTVGAITGGIAGLYYGYDEIPGEWLVQIKDLNEVLRLCDYYKNVITL